jgi:hypothetical protein
VSELDGTPLVQLMQNCGLNWRILFNVSGGWRVECWDPEDAYAYDSSEIATIVFAMSLHRAVRDCLREHRGRRHD